MVLETLTRKYIKAKSGTFWIGMIPMIGGAVEFLDNFIPLGIAPMICHAMFGDTSPFMLTMIGAGTITMRAAIPDLRSLK